MPAPLHLFFLCRPKQAAQKSHVFANEIYTLMSFRTSDSEWRNLLLIKHALAVKIFDKRCARTGYLRICLFEIAGIIGVRNVLGRGQKAAKPEHPAAISLTRHMGYVGIVHAVHDEDVIGRSYIVNAERLRAVGKTDYPVRGERLSRGGIYGIAALV